jgi:beta-galactosidase GanA
LLLLTWGGIAAAVAAPPIPVLAQRGAARQLLVDGRPFLILGGELANSSASSLTYMAPVWPRLRAMHLNTVLTPVSWELIEPEEGRFDFQIVDGLLAQAREQDMRLVLLWFGSWKNSMSCYAPAWVKTDSERFPRARRSTGEAMEILTPFAAANVEADARAFATLMRHLRETDGARHTVVLVQVENEIGMIPEARDRHPAADAAFSAPVPAELLQYLTSHRDTLAPELRDRWVTQGARTSGTWTEEFGGDPATSELIKAWAFGRYVAKVAAAGRGE